MAQNGISTLPTKEARQAAKLALAQAKRQAAGTAGYRYNNVADINSLPTKYSGNTVVDNAAALVQGRPWTGHV